MSMRTLRWRSDLSVVIRDTQLLTMQFIPKCMVFIQATRVPATINTFNVYVYRTCWKKSVVVCWFYFGVTVGLAWQY